jgi:O-antigen ligase
LASGVFQAILATAQFFKQSSLGIKFIEAGKYFPGAPGIATFLMGDDKVMRAYGSFLHPNVLAGFLLLAIFCFYALWIKNRIKPIFMIGFFVLVFGLFVTFSRESIFTFLFISFVFFLARFYQLRVLEHTEERLMAGKKLIALASFFVIFCIISSAILLPYMKSRFFTISIEEEAIDLRFFYNKIAIQMIKEKPILGIGIGNFVDYSHNYPAFLRAASKMAGINGQKTIPDWIFQPAHNIYLLIASEIGIFGFLFFVLFILIKISKSIKPIKPKEIFDVMGPMPFLFIAFLIIGLSDHYFWTLQSGGIMFWLSLAMLQDNL